MKETNGIKHNFVKGEWVWCVSCPAYEWHVFEIVNITDKRIVCKDIGFVGSHGAVLHHMNYDLKNFSPENLFRWDRHVKTTA